MKKAQMTHQLTFDFDIAPFEHSDQPTRLLATLPFPPATTPEPAPFYGSFLPRRMLDKNGHYRR
ncbi:hypothetical protein [Pseudomonas sp. RL_105y_Pfl2_101]|uniref:hypothetical protein n=1 Tax=Pseudomonas sp. RL_105y_Pfl2_101 TaxID=3088708 RepID=UPI0030DC8AFE